MNYLEDVGKFKKNNGYVVEVVIGRDFSDNDSVRLIEVDLKHEFGHDIDTLASSYLNNFKLLSPWWPQIHLLHLFDS